MQCVRDYDHSHRLERNPLHNRSADERGVEIRIDKLIKEIRKIYSIYSIEELPKCKGVPSVVNFPMMLTRMSL